MGSTVGAGWELFGGFWAGGVLPVQVKVFGAEDNEPGCELRGAGWDGNDDEGLAPGDEVLGGEVVGAGCMLLWGGWFGGEDAGLALLDQGETLGDSRAPRR